MPSPDPAANTENLIKPVVSLDFYTFGWSKSYQNLMKFEPATLDLCNRRCYGSKIVHSARWNFVLAMRRCGETTLDQKFAHIPEEDTGTPVSYNVKR